MHWLLGETFVCGLYVGDMDVFRRPLAVIPMRHDNNMGLCGRFGSGCSHLRNAFLTSSFNQISLERDLMKLCGTWVKEYLVIKLPLLFKTKTQFPGQGSRSMRLFYRLESPESGIFEGQPLGLACCIAVVLIFFRSCFTFWWLIAQSDMVLSPSWPEYEIYLIPWRVTRPP